MKWNAFLKRKYRFSKKKKQKIHEKLFTNNLLSDYRQFHTARWVSVDTFILIVRWISIEKSMLNQRIFFLFIYTILVGSKLAKKKKLVFFSMNRNS